MKVKLYGLYYILIESKKVNELLDVNDFFKYLDREEILIVLLRKLEEEKEDKQNSIDAVRKELK